MNITWKSEKRQIKDLRGFEGNPRKASEKEVEDLTKSIDRFDLADPLVINTDGEVIGGNFRLSILQTKGIEEVDVRVPSRELTRKEAEELNLRLNRNSGTWNYDILANFGEDMLKDVGFESEEIDRIFLGGEYEDDFNLEEEIDKIKEPKIKLGEIFQLGEHRIMCGDATKIKDVRKLMGESQADMVWTDAPYNMDYKSRGKLGKIQNDNMDIEKFLEFTDGFIKNIVQFSKKTASIYLACNFTIYPTFLRALNFYGIRVGSMIIWVKNNFVLSGKDYHGKYELVAKTSKGKKKKEAQPILYGWQEGNEHVYLEDRTQSDVWEITKRSANTMIHPTQKPIELISRAIRNSSKRDEIVLDLFGGSFSTLISCEKEGRLFYGMDLDPKYVEIGINRWQKFTGKEPKRI